MTASTHLEYEDQATGSNNNTWGDVADENFRIFEKAITDTSLSVSTTGGVSTLTTEQNRAPMLVVTGTLASNATIRIRDSARKIFWVRNNTAGSFTLTRSTASGTGVTVPRRRFVMLYSNGTNVSHGHIHGVVPYTEAAGTVDALTATFTPPFLSNELVDGSAITILAAGANATTTPTLAVDGTTARTIQRLNGAALAAGDIAGAGHVLHLVYSDTDNRWRLLNPAFADVAKTDVANTFTLNQTIQSNNTGAGLGPSLVLDRDSSSAADGDEIGTIDFRGNDDAGTPANVTYARIGTDIVDSGAGSEDGLLHMSTMLAGVFHRQVNISDGVYLATAAGSAKGRGSINATDYFQNGTRLWRPIYKTADETVTTDTVLSNDAALLFSVATSTKYSFRFRVWFDSAIAADFKFGINGPATPTIFRAAYTYIDPEGLDVTNTLSAYETTGIAVVYATTNTGGYVSINGIIQNGSNAGSVSFTWAQNTSNAGNTTVLAGSYVEYAVLD